MIQNADPLWLLKKVKSNALYHDFTVEGLLGQNDNGILFATEFYWVCHHHGLIDDKDNIRFKRAVKLLERDSDIGPTETIKGLYNRRHGLNTVPEAFDNYVGIIAGSILRQEEYGETLHFPLDIYAYGSANNWIYDNVRGDNTTEKIDATRWRNPSEQAFYILSAMRYLEPNILQYVWFFVANLYSAIVDMRFSKTSNLKLSYLRFKTLDLRISKKRITNRIFIAAYKILKKFWLIRLLNLTDGKGMEKIYDVYFPSEHAIPLMSKGLIY